ncbi:MAG TPA: hypothetical protein VKS03_08170 [Thermoanaerobaculia bacterium]|nr:hypothetical protein [Thermoanaerobaculia bacterium]
MTRGSSPLVWHREEAVSRLRASLLALTDEEHSLCQVAAERGIFCRGFRRWGEAEFDRRWRKFIGRSRHLSREQMEQYANIWELAEQIRQRVSLACDAQITGRGPCRGWNEFSNADLARFCSDVLGQNVEVVE